MSNEKSFDEIVAELMQISLSAAFERDQLLQALCELIAAEGAAEPDESARSPASIKARALVRRVMERKP